MNYRLPIMLVICSALMLGGCSTRKPPAAITGSVGYSAPIQFSSGNVQLQLFLSDVSSVGAAPEVASTTVSITHLPYEYSLPYETGSIDQSHRYTIYARIYVDGGLKYATDSAVEVLTQGHGNRADFNVIETGNHETSIATTRQAAEIFQSEIRNSNDISLYRAGLIDDHISWLEEDRSNGTPTPLHSHYEFKGALLIHYTDSSVDITFDDSGKPKSVMREGKPTDVAQAMTVINLARNRASLLRADALAKRESQKHRKETKNDVNG